MKKSLWLFPFIGTIITLSSFFTPAAVFFYQSSSYSTEFYRWMLDFYISHVYEMGVHTTSIGINTDLTGYISFTISFLIIAFNIYILISVNNYRKEKLAPKISWLVLSLFTIILTIIWMVMKEISTINSFNHSFWGLLSPCFGIVGPFLGASLIIVGYLLLKYALRTN